MFLLKLLMKVLLLPVMLVLFVLRVLVKIGIELSSIVIGGLMLIVFGCIIICIYSDCHGSLHYHDSCRRRYDRVFPG